MKRILLSLVCSLLCICSYAGADRTEAWIKSRFIDSRIPPFSFKLDGVCSDEFIGKWSRKMTLKASDGDVSRLQCVYTSPDRTLRLSCDIDEYKDFQAVEWTLHFTNISGADSPQITDVKAADLTFAAPRRRSGVRYDLYTARGTNANDRDFHLETHEILPDSLYRYVPSGGRPSSKTAFPYYNIATSTGGSVTGGTFFSIGWTGTWFAEFSRNSADALEFRRHERDGPLSASWRKHTHPACVGHVLGWRRQDRRQQQVPPLRACPPFPEKCCRRVDKAAVLCRFRRR